MGANLRPILGVIALRHIMRKILGVICITLIMSKFFTI
jgi:hypothetical protein